MAHLTPKERALLSAISTDQYLDGQDPVGTPVWTWSPCLDFGASAGGIVASLLKKGLVGIDHDDPDPDEHTIWITQKGADALAWEITKAGSQSS